MDANNEEAPAPSRRPGRPRTHPKGAPKPPKGSRPVGRPKKSTIRNATDESQPGLDEPETLPRRARSSRPPAQFPPIQGEEVEEDEDEDDDDPDFHGSLSSGDEMEGIKRKLSKEKAVAHDSSDERSTTGPSKKRRRTRSPVVVGNGKLMKVPIEYTNDVPCRKDLSLEQFRVIHPPFWGKKAGRTVDKIEPLVPLTTPYPLVQGIDYLPPEEYSPDTNSSIGDYWATEDELVLKLMSKAELGLWRRVKALYGIPAPEILVDPLQFKGLTLVEVNFPGLHEKGTAWLEQQNWGAGFCGLLNRILFCIAFEKDLGFLRYILQYAVHLRVGPKYVMPPKESEVLDYEDIAAEFNAELFQYQDDVETVACIPESHYDVINNFVNRHFRNFRHPYMNFVAYLEKNIKKEYTPDMDGEYELTYNGITNLDIQNIIDVWDQEYITDPEQRNRLKTMKGYQDEYLESGNSGKGKSRKDGPTPDDVTRCEKRTWILGCRMRYLHYRERSHSQSESTPARYQEGGGFEVDDIDFVFSEPEIPESPLVKRTVASPAGSFPAGLLPAQPHSPTSQVPITQPRGLSQAQLENGQVQGGITSQDRPSFQAASVPGTIPSQGPDSPKGQMPQHHPHWLETPGGGISGEVVNVEKPSPEGPEVPRNGQVQEKAASQGDISVHAPSIPETIPTQDSESSKDPAILKSPTSNVGITGGDGLPQGKTPSTQEGGTDQIRFPILGKISGVRDLLALLDVDKFVGDSNSRDHRRVADTHHGTTFRGDDRRSVGEGMRYQCLDIEDLFRLYKASSPWESVRIPQVKVTKNKFPS